MTIAFVVITSPYYLPWLKQAKGRYQLGEPLGKFAPLF